MFNSKSVQQPKLTNRLKTTLEFSELWNLTEQERYVFESFHNKLKGLNASEINIQGVKLYKNENGIIITAIIRHSLPKRLLLNDVSLVVRDIEEKELARKDFSMESFGELASMRARPWMFEFESESLLLSLDEIKDQMEFEVVFEFFESVDDN